MAGKPGQDRDRFSTATRLRLLGEQTAARVYRSQTRRQARRSRLTGRAALLALVLCSLVVALAYPMRQYVSQRAEIADQERQRAGGARRGSSELRDEKARWQDDAYVRAAGPGAAALRAAGGDRLHRDRPGRGEGAPRRARGRPTGPGTRTSGTASTTPTATDRCRPFA